ncbi:hypothetical protein BOTBODRAFT_49651 [Botryobasidium botryosum FD-172 SS1]|uniref:Glycolipid transfer protein domain-containing protein n=1 Tax=Botryobasidium botryosum (strain FD-172 SS1) TaxID=930990 RepID=A0A067LRR3_BOTB1|nr:hypothetical protein BOTBODRAFT_49651 [Botryobasidium botryosum FD-172 SS1]
MLAVRHDSLALPSSSSASTSDEFPSVRIAIVQSTSWWPAPYPPPLTYAGEIPKRKSAIVASKPTAQHSPPRAPTSSSSSWLRRKPRGKRRGGGGGSLWLLRVMNSACKALQNNSAQLSESFTKSYTPTLRPFHNFTGGIFKTPMLACLTGETFVTKLRTPKEKIEEQPEAWLDALGAILKRLMAFFIAGKYFNAKDDAFGKAAA